MNKFPCIATDIIIEYQDGIVLIERKYPPFGLAIPGGHAEYGLTLEENAIKESLEETGLEVRIKNPEHPLCVFSSPIRDPRCHMISVTYIATGYGTLKAGDDAKEARVYSLHELKSIKNSLVFDHKRIIEEYLKYKEAQ
jgi:ADP-ribose pyrophosphatase YjhB (NUDIX family)